jgi:phosphoglycerate kinase
MKKELDFLATPSTTRSGRSSRSSAAPRCRKIDAIEALLPGRHARRRRRHGLYLLQGAGQGDRRLLVEGIASRWRKRLAKAGPSCPARRHRRHDAFDFDARKVGTLKTVAWDTIGPKDIGVDIGEATRAKFAGIVKGAKTVVWNGPMGVFEIDATAKGTFAVAQALADATSHGAITVVGGGDSVAAIEKNGLENAVSHVSTGGGASLEFLEGKALPGVTYLTDK